MTTLADFEKVDLVDDHLAADYNRLMGAALRAEFANTETIAATKELADSDCQVQIITPSGANRTVELPPEATTNHVHIISVPTGATYDVVLKDDSGSTTHCTLDAGDWALCIPDGTSWLVIFSGNITLLAGRITTHIDGMKLTWNSTTSITVGVGACYAENGDWIDVTSALVKSSLSLSVSTWYHVYVYLSGGTPTAEVVTTAPVAWKGTAYSKTGDTSRRYVGSIKSDASSNVYPFEHDVYGMIMHYKLFDGDSSPFRALNGGTSTTAASVAMTGALPVTARLAKVRLLNTADRTLLTSESNGVGSSLFSAVLNNGNTTPTSFVMMHPMDSSQNIWYIMSGAVGVGAVYIDMLGYQFER